MCVARGVDMEAANAKFKPAKAKALKVLDGKSAQNICESICLCVCVRTMCYDFVIPSLCVSLTFSLSPIPSLLTVSHAVGYPS